MVYNDRKIVKKFQIALRRSLFKTNIVKSHIIHNYITQEELIKKMEDHFLPEMNWDNFGKIWEVSHLIPVIYFDHTNESDLKLCWNVKNIIPMLKEDNKHFGSCLLFARLWFEKNQNKNDYKEYINFINDKLPIYSKYMN